jgi:hypothetical protein
MARRFTLYWTNFLRYEECPQKFLWYAGWGTIDVGGGPGRKKPIPEQRSEHHILMGVVVGGVLEDLYNREHWKLPGDELKKLLRTRTQQAFDLEWAKRTIIPYKSPSRAELLKTCHEGVQGYLPTMVHNRLLGPYAKSEVNFKAYVNPLTSIGGRCDFMFRRDDTGITILDGKNSKRYYNKKKDTYFFYTDPDQLRWYALCFYLKHGRMPDRLGFVYFRYPWGTVLDGETEPYSGVTWVEFTKEDLVGLATRAAEVREKMEREEFHALPTPPKCKFCDYQSVCPERQEQIERNRRGRKPKKKDILDNADDGYVEFSIGDL